MLYWRSLGNVHPKRKHISESLICLALLALIPVTFVFPLIKENSIPLFLDGVFLEPPWEEARHGDVALDVNPYHTRHVLQYYPAFQFMHHSIENRASLLWNSYEGFGNPFLALWKTRVLSPFSLPIFVLPLVAALQWSLLLKMIVAGWCAFYASIRFGFSTAIALFIALCFQLGGPIFLWAGFPMSDVLPWLPLYLLCLERFAVGQYRAWPITAITIALMGFGGDPETLLAIIVFGILYVVVRRLRDPEAASIPGSVLSIGIALVFGIGIIGVQILPFIEYKRQAIAPYTDDLVSLQLRDLVALFDPAARLLTTPNPQKETLYHLLFAGTVPMMLLAFWPAVRGSAVKLMRRRMEALSIAALVMAMFPFLGGIHNYLPLLHYLGPEHFLVVLGLAFTFLAASTAEEWLEMDAEACKVSLKRLGISLPICWGLVLVIFIYSKYGLSLESPLFHYILIALFLLALMTITLFNPRIRVLGYGLCILAVVNFYWLSSNQLPSTRSEHIFPETQFIHSLQQVNSRIGGSDTMKRWPLAGNRISQVYSTSGAFLSRYMQYIEQVDSNPLLLRRSGAEVFLLTKEDIQGEFASVRPVLSIQEVFPTGAVLFRDLEAKPRARMIYEARPVESFNPELLHPERPPLLEGASLPERDSGARARARLEPQVKNTEVRVHVERTRPGVLVLSDAWYPGWNATLNGQKVPILPVDGIFRGIEVGEGEHQIVFTYRPLSLIIGCVLSLVSLIVTMFYFFKLRSTSQ